MSLSRPLVAFLGVGILGIAGVGLGAGATFTDSTQSLQTITAGAMDVTVSTPSINGGVPDKTLTFAAFGPTGSTFKTAPRVITMHFGPLIPTQIYFGVSNDQKLTADLALMKGTYVCIQNGADVIWNDTVWNLSRLTNGVGAPAGILAPAGTRAYTAEFYAGIAATQCGTSTELTAPTLKPAAQGGVMNTSIDVTYVG